MTTRALTGFCLQGREIRCIPSLVPSQLQPRAVSTCNGNIHEGGFLSLPTEYVFKQRENHHQDPVPLPQEVCATSKPLAWSSTPHHATSHCATTDWSNSDSAQTWPFTLEIGFNIKSGVSFSSAFLSSPQAHRSSLTFPSAEVLVLQVVIMHLETL